MPNFKYDPKGIYRRKDIVPFLKEICADFNEIASSTVQTEMFVKVVSDKMVGLFLRSDEGKVFPLKFIPFVPDIVPPPCLAPVFVIKHGHPCVRVSTGEVDENGSLLCFDGIDVFNKPVLYSVWASLDMQTHSENWEEESKHFDMESLTNDKDKKNANRRLGEKEQD